MRDLIKRFFQLYGAGFRRRFVSVSGLAILAGVFETFGLFLIYPVLRILMDPEVVLRIRPLRFFYELLNLSAPRHLAGILALVIAGIFVLKNIYMVYFTRLQLNLMRDWMVRIRDQLIRYYLQSPYSLYLLNSSSTLMSNIDNFAVKAVTNVALPLMNLTVNVIIIFIIMVLLSLRYLVFLVMIGLITGLCIYSLHKLLRRTLYRLSLEERAAVVEERKALMQSFASIRETKVSNAEEFFVQSFDSVNYKVMDLGSQSQFYQRIPPFVLELVMILSIMGMGAVVSLSGDGTGTSIISSLGVLAAAAFRLTPLASRVVTSLSDMSAGRPFLETVVKEAENPDFFVLQELASSKVDKLPLSRELRLKNVSFHYPESENQALKNLSFSIKRGEFVGIVGASGAGKSTFADLLLGLLEPQQGQILIDDVVLTQDNVRNWRANIGYVPQEVVLTDVTVRESIAFGIKAEDIDDAQVELALKKARLWDFVQTLPKGIYASVGEGGRSFSGGQRQRIAIARALYRDTELLMLDEATSALDNTTEFEVASAIEALRGDCTILVIAHRLSTLKRSDRILFFREGELVDSGSFAELSKHKDFEHMLEVSKIEV